MDVRQAARIIGDASANGASILSAGQFGDQAQEVIATGMNNNLLSRTRTGHFSVNRPQILHNMNEEKEIGDSVMVVSGGKKYTGLIKSKKGGGRYTVSFGDDVPEDHDDDKDYSEDQFGDV